MICVEAKNPKLTAIKGFQRFAEAMPCIVWIADAFGEIEWYNQDFHRYSGLTIHSALARSWLSITHEDDRHEITRAYAHAVATGNALNTVVRLRNVEGAYRWFSVRARLFRGESTKWLGTLTDIHDTQMTCDANAQLVNALMKDYLSKEFPKVKGLRFDALYEAANIVEKLGGDWYDTFALADGRVGFSIGDVCGHGIDAAVKMIEAKQAIFVAACLEDSVPESVLCKANSVLFLRRNHILTTAVYGVVDITRCTITYVSAGHHPPMLALSDRETVILPNHGFPLGVEEHMPPCKTHEFTYEPGSMLVLYTDGLIEFTRDLFEGEARLLTAAAESVRCKADHPATFIAEHVLGDAHPNDDIAVLTLSFEDG